MNRFPIAARESAKILSLLLSLLLGACIQPIEDEGTGDNPDDIPTDPSFFWQPSKASDWVLVRVNFAGGFLRLSGSMGTSGGLVEGSALISKTFDITKIDTVEFSYLASPNSGTIYASISIDGQAWRALSSSFGSREQVVSLVMPRTSSAILLRNASQIRFRFDFSQRVSPNLSYNMTVSNIIVAGH